AAVKALERCEDYRKQALQEAQLTSSRYLWRAALPAVGHSLSSSEAEARIISEVSKTQLDSLLAPVREHHPGRLAMHHGRILSCGDTPQRQRGEARRGEVR